MKAIEAAAEKPLLNEALREYALVKARCRGAKYPTFSDCGRFIVDTGSGITWEVIPTLRRNGRNAGNVRLRKV